MSQMPDGARKVIVDYTSKALQTAAGKYATVNGKPLDPRLVAFLCAFVSETVEFLWESAEDPEKLNARMIAVTCLKRANAAVGLFSSDDAQLQSMIDCGVAAVSLALTIGDTAELEIPLTEAVTVATAATGGAAAPGYVASLAVGVFGALYAMYEAYDAIEVCAPLFDTPDGQTVPAKVENVFPASDNVPATRVVCIEDAQDLVCSPDHPDPPTDDAASSSSGGGDASSSNSSSSPSSSDGSQTSSSTDPAASSSSSDPLSTSSDGASSSSSNAPAAS